MSQQTLGEGRFLRLVRDGRWEYVQRTNSSGAVFIVAVTAARELVLVEQQRIPVGARTIELPAGMIGDEAAFKDETISASAIRELEEETGYRGARAQILLSGPVAPGLTSEQLHLVQVFDLQKVGEGGGVDDEDITVHVIPLTNVRPWLRAQAQTGKQIEPRIYAALDFVGQAG